MQYSKYTSKKALLRYLLEPNAAVKTADAGTLIASHKQSMQYSKYSMIEFLSTFRICAGVQDCCLGTECGFHKHIARTEHAIQ